MLVSQKDVLRADAHVVTEARRNLSAKAPAASLRVLDELLARIKLSATNIVGSDKGFTAWLPEKDRSVLVAAMNLQCDMLVTGDIAHFGAGFGKSFSGVVIYLPRLLADVVLGRV